MKKLISLLLVLTVLFTSLVFASVTVTATQSKAYNFNRNYTLTGNPIDDIVAVANAQNGSTKADLGYTEAWCADFVSDCAELAGVGDLIPRDGYCGNLYTNIINAGGIEVDTPQKGDIIFYYCNAYCPGSGAPWVHVGIMTSSSSSIEGNSSGKVTSKSRITYTDMNGHTYGHSGTNSVSVKYVRPNYGNTSIPVNIGESFYAFIINTKMWKHLTVEQDNNVDIRGEKSNYCADQIWKFERQNDNSYKIISIANGECLDVHNASNENGTNVKTCNDNGSDAQRWFIYPNNNSFYLKAKCTDCVLDITGGYSDDGTNVQMYAKNDTYAQAFTVYQIESRPFAANLGTDFTAPILNLKEWITLENGEDGNISLQKETGRSNQLWRFVRKIDGSYKIYSCYDGKCVDLDMALFENGTNIKICDSNDNDAQRWYLYEYNGGYAIQSKRSGKFIDCTGGSLSAGTNLQAWEWNGSDAQVFAIYRGEECKLSAVNLSVTPKKGCAMLNWTKTYGETNFALKIWNNKVLEGEPYIIKTGIPARTNNIQIELPVGNYEGYIISKNAFEAYTSNIVSFSIVEPPAYLGDANGDGSIGIEDATVIQRHLTSFSVSYPKEVLMNADVDKDGELSIVDSTLIQRYIAKIKTSYPIGETIN